MPAATDTAAAARTALATTITPALGPGVNKTNIHGFFTFFLQDVFTVTEFGGN